MKKSRAIPLTVVAVMGLAGQTQPPAKQQANAATCEERRQAAQLAGIQPTENCGHSAGAHSTARGGFGATGKTHSGGG